MPHSDRIPLAEVIDRFLENLRVERRYSPKTVDAYRGDLLGGPDSAGRSFLAHVIDATGRDEPAIDEATRTEIRGYVAALHRRGMARRSIVRRLASVKSLMKYAVERGMIPTNPARLVQGPKPEKRLPTVLGRQEAERMLELPDATTARGARDRLVLELLYATGVRRSELAGVRLAQIDRRNRTIRVHGKGGRERIVPYGEPAARALDAYLERRAELMARSAQGAADRLLLGERGGALDGAGIYRIVRRYMSRVTEQSKRSPHVLRHSFATHMLDAGAGLREVGEMLGHASLSSTQIYTHVTIERLKSAYQGAHPRAGRDPEAGRDAAPTTREDDHSND